MRPFILSLLLLSLSISAKTQILNADMLGAGVDSTHAFKAAFNIGFNIQKQVDIIYSFNTNVDMSYYYKRSLFVVVGNFNLFRSGSVNILNGGYAHTRIRFLKDFWVHPEVFAQYQADGIRGMEQRVLGGANARFVIKEYDKGHFHVGVGAMYEYERWNYSAVPATVVLSDRDPIDNHYVKLNIYASFTQRIKEVAAFQITVYFQTRPDSYFIAPRLSANGSMVFNITKHIRFSVNYNLFYDAKPVVPIDQLFFSVVNTLSFVF